MLDCQTQGTEADRLCKKLVPVLPYKMNIPGRVRQFVRPGLCLIIPRGVIMSRPGIVFSPAICLLAVVFLFTGCSPKPIDWEDFDVLKQPPPGPQIPKYHGQEIPYDEYRNWVKWGEEWFRHETFGNEKFLTDIVGVVNADVNIVQGNGWRNERFLKSLLEAIDGLDAVRGNLYSGNGDGYTNDLVLSFPPGSMLDMNLPLPERLHTGLDVEAGSAWPIGIVPVPVQDKDTSLPYLLDPSKYSFGPTGVGPVPDGKKFRAGFSCALCHYSLDIDWDGKPDLKSARPGVETPGSLYKPQNAWAVGNQDLHLGWLFVTARNPIAALFASGRPGKLTPADARQWMEEILGTYKTNPQKVKREIVQGVQLMPRGYFDDTPDAIHNPLQYPVLFTRGNWPYNYDGVMLNASDRNNNVWTVSFDPSEFVGLCKDRGGKTANLLFWIEPGVFSAVTAREYADLLVSFSPAAEADPASADALREDILGTSDGMPGILRNDAVVIVDGTTAYLSKEVVDHPDNQKYHRIRKAEEFGDDGNLRNQMTGLLGIRVITTPEIRMEYHVDALETKYGLNGDEFVTEAVSHMLDWVDPPMNHSTLLANARQAGLVEKGYEIFTTQGCASCHAGPFFTNNKIIPLDQIGTNGARARATEPLQTFVAPEYDPSTGKAISTGFFGFFAKLFGSKQKYGYKVVTLRYLWGTAPYLHDGGVGVSLRPGSASESDLQALLKRPEHEKLYGMGQILSFREANPESYLRPSAALSLQALLLESERQKVVTANHEAVIPDPGRSERVSMNAMNVQGIGHDMYIDDTPGGDKITALVAFLLALDDDPGQ